jgi:hypothetical protein
MKTFYHPKLLVLPAVRKLIFALYCLLQLSVAARGQSLSLSISATNNSPNNCNARTISVSVSGGSGNYAYYWSSSPPSNVYLGNGPAISVSPAGATTYTVAVQDNSTSQFAQKSILVSPLLTGSLSLFTPNAFLEGNLWRVMDSANGTGPLNAYRYELSIIDDWGNQVYSASRTVSTGTVGLVGGEISWNGRLYGTGNYVPAGNYFYDLRLINCSTNQLFRKTITFFRPLMVSVEVFPNPAQEFVALDLGQAEEPMQSTARGAVSFPAEIELLTGAGSPVYKTSIAAFPALLDLRTLKDGEYVLVVRMENQTIKKRLLIRR